MAMDNEIKAMLAMKRTLQPFPYSTQKRILQWVSDRSFEEEQEKHMGPKDLQLEQVIDAEECHDEELFEQDQNAKMHEEAAPSDDSSLGRMLKKAKTRQA